MFMNFGICGGYLLTGLSRDGVRISEGRESLTGDDPVSSLSEVNFGYLELCVIVKSSICLLRIPEELSARFLACASVLCLICSRKC